MEICVVGARGTRSDMALIDIAPSKGNAIDIYYNNPKEVFFVRSLPASEFEKREAIAKGATALVSQILSPATFEKAIGTG